MFLNATTATPFRARFPAKKRGVAQMHRSIYNILLPRTGWHLIPFPPPQRVYGRTLRHNQIFSDGWFTKFSYPWCSAGALRAPELRYNTDTSVKRTLGSVPLVFVLERFDCNRLSHNILNEDRCWKLFCKRCHLCYISTVYIVTLMPNWVKCLFKINKTSIKFTSGGVGNMLVY